MTLGFNADLKSFQSMSIPVYQIGISSAKRQASMKNKQSDAKYKVGLIGCGRKGTEHAMGYRFHPLTEVVAAADTDPENLALFCERFDVPGYADYEEMLDKERIDIAAPILPTSANPEVVLRCAAAGVKAIFCEKPMSASLEDADRMVEVCRSRGIKFAAGDAFRNLPQYWSAREMIEAGEIGEILSINLYDATSTISGAGCQGLSLMRMFAWDSDVDQVVGHVMTDPFSDDDQDMGGYVRFSSGIECLVHAKSAARRGIEVMGSHGTFASDYSSFHLWKLDKGANPQSAKLSELHEIGGLFQDVTYGPRQDCDGKGLPGYRQMASIHSIVDSLEKDIEPRCSGNNMLKVLEIAIALRESHRRGHAPVKLPLENRSLKIIPVPARWLNKKEVYGREWYAKEMDRYT